MKVVYIAGRFRGENAWEIEQNTRAAEELALLCAKAGFSPLCPHANTRYFHGTLPNDFWLDATLELMRRCDAVLLVSNWTTSEGARNEVVEARRLNIPVFGNLDDLVRHFCNT